MVNLTCTQQDSCSNTAIYAPNTDNLLVNCIETDACYGLKIYGDYAKNITVTCQGDATSSSYSACYQLHIYGNFSDQITLICNGDYSCYYPYIFAYHANKLIIEVIGEYGSYNGAIHGEYVNESMIIDCQSEYGEHGCYWTSFYVPSNKTNIKCEGHGCYNMKLYARNGFTDINSISWNGCTECSSIANCLNYWQMYCGQSYVYQTKMYSSYCRYYQNGYTSNIDQCGCQDFQALALDTFINTFDDICKLLLSDIVCGISDVPDCTPDCSRSNCAGKVINGGDVVTSISIECDYNGACQNTKIICPTTKNSDCNITCTGGGSYDCSNLNIYGSTNGNINLNCTEGTCSSVQIYGEKSNNIQFSCIGATCSSSTIYATDANSLEIICQKSSGCYGLSIYGKNLETANILCDDYEACYNANFHLDNVTNVSIKASGRYGLYNSNIYIGNASFSNITCIGTAYSDAGCYYSDFTINPANTILNCYGYGCYRITLTAKHSEFKDFKQILFDKGDTCSSIDSCIFQWSLYSDFDCSLLWEYCLLHLVHRIVADAKIC